MLVRFLLLAVVAGHSACATLLFPSPVAATEFHVAVDGSHGRVPTGLTATASTCKTSEA